MKTLLLSILSITTISLIARLTLFFYFTGLENHHLVYFDSAQYQIVAENIVLGNGIAGKDNLPQGYRLPGYPLFLATLYSIIGNNQHIAMLIQIMISCLIPILVYMLSLTLFPQAFFTAIASGFLSAVHIGFVLYAGMLATETLFLIFLLLFFIGYFKLIHIPNPTLKTILLPGFFLGCASLVRPIGHYLVFLSLLIYFFTATGSLVLKLRTMALLLISWIATCAPWLIRNYLIFGAPFFHTLPGLHFLQYSAAKIVMHTHQLNYVEARGMLLDEWKQKQEDFERTTNRKPNELEACHMAEKISRNLIIKHPIPFLKNSLLEILKTFLALYSAQLIFADTQAWTEYKASAHSLLEKIKQYLWPQVNTWWLKIITLNEILMNLLLLIGLFGFLIISLFNQTLWRTALYTLPFITLLLGVTCAYGCARLRMPLEPFIIIFALQFWVQYVIEGKPLIRK